MEPCNNKQCHHRHGALAMAFVMLLLPSASPLAGDLDPSPSPSEIAAALAQWERSPAEKPTRRHGNDLVRFYTQRNHRPLWLAAADRHRATALREALDNAAQEGLHPLQYALPPPGVMGAASLEIAMSDAFLRYAVDLRVGRLTPTMVDPEMIMVEKPVDYTALLTAVERAGDVERYIESLAPRSADYTALKESLARYRAIAARGGWAPIAGGPALRPGMRDERVERLRQRLEIADLVETATTDRIYYDPALAAAVRDFQARMGLEVDGVVGTQTLAALNVPVDRRIDQIVINMERWRWMPKDLGRDHILVNIADFELRAVSGGKTVLSMRVIIGRPYRQTPVFSERLSYLEFNPSWNVPTRIAVQDLVPQLRKEPGYFAEQGIVVYDDWEPGARPIDPATIDWMRYSLRNFPFRLRQEPGPLNALGRVKFMFPNRFSVYLHDTPAKTLFGRVKRAASSGCVRVEKPMELAEFALRDQPEWTRERIDEVVQSGQTRVVRVQRPIMIHIAYATAWVDDDGGLHFRDDIYGRDRRLGSALALWQPIPATLSR